MSDTILVERTVVCKCGDELQPDDGAICGACLQPELAAAEERGRRRGVEEIREALRSVACEHCHKGFFDDPATWGCGSCKALRAALAPRDSAPAAAPQAIPGTHAARREREKARDSGKVKAPPPSHVDPVCNCDTDHMGAQELVRDGEAMTPPDSGEREVTRRMEEACAAADHAGPYVTLCLFCARRRGGVYLDSSLAQRILAALNAHANGVDLATYSPQRLRDLASELSGRLPK